jgi:SAM-dependent methyltransferase
MTDPENSIRDEFTKQLINKVVPFKFKGRELRFALTHALFSSFDVDAGSKLLLKTVAQRLDLSRVKTLLDFGCGTGVLAVSLKKDRPSIDVCAADRDALALAFTRMNAAMNRLGDVRPLGTVGLMHLPPQEFDLAVSNLPAKAGNPVLASVICGMTRFLSNEGALAFVIVKSLEELAESALGKAGYETVYREDTREHAAIHARKTGTHVPDLTLKPYFRGECRARFQNREYALQTVFGLPEFDTLSYATALTRKLMEAVEWNGEILVWNPGQGFLPLYLQRRFSLSGTMTLAGRDLLSLVTSRHNCLAQGADDSRLAVRHVSSLFEVTQSFDRLVVLPDDDPGVPWHRLLLPGIVPRLKEGGLALVAAKSSFLGRIDLSAYGVRIVNDIRAKGFRGIVFQKKN